MDYKNFVLLSATSTSATLTARRNETKAQLEVFVVSVNYDFPDGSPGYGRLAIVYDMETGIAGWEFQILCHPENRFNLNKHILSKADISFELEVNQERISRYLHLLSSIYIQNNKKLLWFTCNGNRIGYAEFIECYSSLEQAKNTITLALSKAIKSYYRAKRPVWFPEIYFREYLRDTYARKPVFRTRSDGIKRRTGTKIIEVYIIDVKRENDHWKLVLEDEIKRQTYVHLSNDYQLLDVTGYVGHNYPAIGEFKDNKTLQEHLNKLYS